ncbi:ATP-dependent DNA helicase PIF1-like [Glycine soja]|uniref:ATP-dependent DNA helicase PIF1-like n=1 Tax=Glycine soja TaxID=3848 RepID=UPI00103C13F8|nr:ATP-dependent DNA helicase PIF1-like [Glycine soja]
MASTGVAAFSIKGQTLHSFSAIHNTTNFDPQNLFEVIMRKIATRTWDKVEALVIDEISMVDSKLFDGLEFVARKLKDVDKRWGGIQLIVVGDFFQLSSVGETEKSKVDKKLKSEPKSVNEKRLKSLQKECFVYRAIDSGDDCWKKQFEHGVTPDVVTICEGARVLRAALVAELRGSAPPEEEEEEES